MMTDRSRFHRFLLPITSFMLASALVACGARSVLDTPGDEAPTTSGGGAGVQTLGGSGGTTAQATGGSAGTMAGGSGGSGGSTHATGGTGGSVTATGGSGGGFAGGCAYPSCVWSLIRDCIPAGQCTQDDSALSGTLITAKICCSNGVNENVRASTRAVSRLVGTVTITKSGQVCYSVDVDMAMDSSSGTYIYRDASGSSVAKATQMSDGSAVVACDSGETVAWSSGCSPDGNSNSTTISGTCP